MAAIYCCGWECGACTAHWTLSSGTPAIETSIVRSGARALRFTRTSSEINGSVPFSGAGPIVGRFYIYFVSLPSADTDLCASSGTSVTACQVRFKQSDSKLYAAVGTTFGASGVSVTTGQWYRIDFRFDIRNAANDLCDVQVDGTACGQATAGGANAYLSFFAFGGFGTFTADFIIDDLVVSSTSGDYPIGAGHVDHFVPTSDGTHNIAGTGDFQRTVTGTDILNATTTAYQLVDDIPLPSGAGVDWINLVLPPNATDYVECVFGPAPGISTPSTAPRAVETIFAYRQAGTGAGNMEIEVNDNGTTSVVYTATGVAGVTLIAYARKHYALAPTGGAWTVTSGAGNFNNLRFRFGSPAAVDANPDQYLAGAMVEAEFAPAGAGDLEPGLLTEGLKVSDSASTLLNPLEASPQEIARVAEQLLQSITPLIVSLTENLKISDSVSAALMLEASATESLKVSDAVTVTLTPLQTSVSESVKVTDSATPALTPLLQSLTESVKVSEDALETLTPLVTTVSESVRVSDVLTQPVLVSEEGDLTREVTAESIRVSDVVTTLLNPLQTTVSESLKVSDAVSTTLNPLGTSLTENVKVSESLTRTLNPLVTSVSESVKVSEDAIETLNPLATSLTESVKVSDVVAPERLDAGTLTAGLTENLKVDDIGQGQTQLVGVIHVTDIISAEMVSAEGDLSKSLTEHIRIADASDSWAELSSPEIVKVTDTVTVLLNPLGTNLTENVKVSDQVTANAGLAASPAEAIKVTDTISALLNPLGTSLTESVKVTEDETATLTPLQASVTEAVKVSDSITANAGLAASPSEAIEVTDSITALLNPEQASLSESIRITDIVETTLSPLQTSLTESIKVSEGGIALIGLSTSPPEAIKVSDIVTATLTPLGTSLSESVKVSEDETATLTPLVVSLTESVKVSDQVTANAGLAFDGTESIEVTDTVAAELLSFMLDASLSEAIKVTDTLTALLPVLEASLLEHLKVSDSINANSGLTASLTENVKVTDTVTTLLNPLQASLTESVLVSDEVTPALTPLVRTLTEAVKVTDTVTAALDISRAVTSESLKVTDTLTAVITPLQVGLLETVRVSETAAGFLTSLAVRLTETVLVSDVLVVVPDYGIPATPDAIIQVGADVGIIKVRPDVGVILVLPDVTQTRAED